MFTQIDVTEGNQKRKKLLEKLAQQAGISAPNQARPVFGGGRPFFSFGNLPPAPSPALTRPFPLPPGLLHRLGIGGAPGRGEYSPGPGIPAGGPTNMPSPPGPPAVGAPMGGMHSGLSEAEMAEWAAGAATDMGSGGGRTLYEGGSPNAPVPTNDILTGGLVPLGGGVFFNPQTGEIHGDAIGGTGSAIRATGNRQIAA